MKRAAIVVGALGIASILSAFLSGHFRAGLWMTSVFGTGLMAGLLWSAPSLVKASEPVVTRTSRTREPLTHWERDKIEVGVCPDCAAVESLAEGAMGGNCVNLTCRSCGAKFNIAKVFGDIPWGERLSDRA